MSQGTFSASGINADRYGKVVCIGIAGEFSISDSWGSKSICTLPAGFRPKRTITAPTSLQESGNNDVTVMFDKDGSVYIKGKGTAWRSGWLFCTVAFVAAD